MEGVYVKQLFFSKESHCEGVPFEGGGPWGWKPPYRYEARPYNMRRPENRHPNQVRIIVGGLIKVGGLQYVEQSGTV